MAAVGTNELLQGLRTFFRQQDSATEKGRLIMVKNGDKKWQKIGDEEVGAHRSPAERPVKFCGPRALLSLKDPAMKVSLLGGYRVGDHAAIGIKLSRKDGKLVAPLHAIASMAVNEVRLNFDKEKGLLLKEEWDFRDLHCEVFHSDYKMFNGIAVAQKRVQRMNGVVNHRCEVEFKIVDKLDAKLFQKP
jgi:hypothetical protein